MEINYIGIDPGNTGGISIIYGDTLEADAIKMPATEKDIIDVFRDITFHTDRKYIAVIEKVSSMPGNAARSMFTFGQNYGFLRACLHAYEISFDEVLPRKWQTYLGCLTKGEKNVTKAKAQQLFPKIKVTHATADSLLIAKYCYEVNK